MRLASRHQDSSETGACELDRILDVAGSLARGWEGGVLVILATGTSFDSVAARVVDSWIPKPSRKSVPVLLFSDLCPEQPSTARA